MPTVFPNKWAVLIGPSNYDHIKPLKYATDDIVAVGDALEKYLGFADKHILRFGTGLKLRPVYDEIYHYLGEIRGGGQVQPDDLLLFYFSGHGFKEKKDYLLPAGATLNNLGKTGLPVEDIAGELSDTGCKNVAMLIDACREEISSKGLSFGVASKDVLESKGIVTLYSCEPDNLSYEIDDLKHGAFTHCFLEAIKSGKCVTAKDLYDYLLRELPHTNTEHKKPPQKPYPIVVGDKWELEIFSGNAQIQQTVQQRQALQQKLGDIYAAGVFEDKYYGAAVEFLDDLSDREPMPSEAKKLQLIEKLCAGKLNMRPFLVAWDAIERQKIQGGGGLQIKTALEPLK